MARSAGVLPDPVIRDLKSEAILVFATLRPDLDRAGVEAWLRRATELVTELVAPIRGRRVASVATGLGHSFFAAIDSSPRFGLDARQPAGLVSAPVVSNVENPSGGSMDVLFYIMATSEAAVAQFLESLSTTRALGLAAVQIERGFQRKDRRELFGFLDGLRNVPKGDRNRVIFVNRDVAPDEPDWTEDGTYLAYLKVRQDVERWANLPQDEQERIMGRRKKDGSRLDLPERSNPRAEGGFADGTPSSNSHIRKSAPRGNVHDRTAIFRRGVPYISLRSDGRVDGGLQFVSFQASLDAFGVVLERWMQNPNFPGQGSGIDRLFAEGFAVIEKAGLYFVPPRDGRFIGAAAFDPPKRERRPRKSGRILVRKRAVDQAGNPTVAEVGGIVFQVFRQETNEPVGTTFTTDSAGHAESTDVPVRVPLVLREVAVPSHLQPSGDTGIHLQRRREIVRIDNLVISGGYGG